MLSPLPPLFILLTISLRDIYENKKDKYVRAVKLYLIKKSMGYFYLKFKLKKILCFIKYLRCKIFGHILSEPYIIFVSRDNEILHKSKCLLCSDTFDIIPFQGKLRIYAPQNAIKKYSKKGFMSGKDGWESYLI